MMARTLLYPNCKCHIIAPTGGQAATTFQKMEDVAMGKIASQLNTTTTFLESCVSQGKGVSPFSHSKSGSHVSLFNGSEITSLISVPENIVGIRSNLLVYDEAGKISQHIYALTKPFVALDSNYVSGSNVDTALYPKQIPNQIIEISSAESVTSELYQDFQYCYEQMLMGRRDYFCMSIDYHFPLHPTTYGIETPPLLTQEVLDNALEANPFKFFREYGNRFDEADSEMSFVRRSTIRKFSQPYYPERESRNSKAKYVIAYDPSSRIDKSVIMVGELIRSEEKGLTVKLVNMRSLTSKTPNGKTVVMQQPDQIKVLKEMIAKYNGGAPNLSNIAGIYIDAGAGGGGFQIAQYLIEPWEYNGVTYPGIIDLENPYQALIADEHPDALPILTLVNFVKSKTDYYTAAENMINEGLITFPASPNAKMELEFEEEDLNGEYIIRKEQLGLDDIETLTLFDIAKEEICGMEKVKKDNGNIQYRQSVEAISRNLHDDAADTLSFICYHLSKTRALEVLDVEAPINNLSTLYARPKRLNIKGKNTNPFNKGSSNPFRATRSGGFIK